MLGSADYFNSEEDTAFLSNIMQYIFKTLGIRIKVIHPYNHGSLRSEILSKVSNYIVVRWLVKEGKQ